MVNKNHEKCCYQVLKLETQYLFPDIDSSDDIAQFNENKSKENMESENSPTSQFLILNDTYLSMENVSESSDDQLLPIEVLKKY